MDYDLTRLEALGLDTETGIKFTGGPEKYISALQRFYKGHDKNRAKVEKYLADKDYESYTITVHALKSNSKMIGATELGSMFEELEMAGKSGDTAAIEAKTEPAVSCYTSLVEKLKPIGRMGEVHAPDEISADEARQTADKLLAALDDFDDELSKELAAKLSGYPFRMTQKEKLTEAIRNIDDFLYDEAADIIREIYPAITE